MTEQPKSVSEETVDPFNLDALRFSRISPKRSPSPPDNCKMRLITAQQGVAQDSANYLPKHVGATAKSSPRIIIAPSRAVTNWASGPYRRKIAEQVKLAVKLWGP
jgi:hypothetical protein